MTNGSPPSSLSVALLVACTGFDGLLHDAGDARGTTDVSLDRADGAPLDDRPPTPDRAPTEGGVRGHCASDRGPCNPVTGEGCPAGQDCRITDFVTLATACGEAGAAPRGAQCAREEDCGRGLHCLTPPIGHCTALCCRDEGAADECAATGRFNRCSVLTNHLLVYGCTAQNACDYVAQQGCPAGQVCAPSNSVGASRCVQPGAVAIGQSCSSAIACVAGATCWSAGPASPGVCRRVCNPLGASSCGAGICRGFVERPGDWGVCM